MNEYIDLESKRGQHQFFLSIFFCWKLTFCSSSAWDIATFHFGWIDGPLQWYLQGVPPAIQCREMSQFIAEIRLRTNAMLNFHKNVGLQRYQWIPDFYNLRFEQNYLTENNYVGSNLMSINAKWRGGFCNFLDQTILKNEL